MTDDTSAALGRLREIAKRDSGIAPGLWSDDARAILAHIAALEARAKEAEARAERAEKCLREPVDNTGDYSHPAWKLRDEQQARAEAAEAKVAAAEERGLVFNMLPDGRLDFCAIREGSRLWDGRAAEAREATLQEALEKIADEQKVYLGHGDYTIEPAYSAEEAQGMARQALVAAPAAGQGVIGWTGRKCPHCSGTGQYLYDPDTYEVACRKCGGTGEEYSTEPKPPAAEPESRERELEGLLREIKRDYSLAVSSHQHKKAEAPHWAARLAAQQQIEGSMRMIARIDAALARKMEGRDAE